MSSYDKALLDVLEGDWRSQARPSQLMPEGDWWSTWLYLGGRGAGKTRAICEAVIEVATTGKPQRIALLSPTAADARDVLVEGASGIMTISREWNRPLYEPSKRRLTWKNGSIATLYTAEESERLRGPQHSFAAVDELAAFPNSDAWEMLQFGLRLGDRPRCIIATTPRPTKLLKSLLARVGKDVALTKSTTAENASNLAPSFMREINALFAGTRLGRQELEAEMLTDIPGAMFQREWFDKARVQKAPIGLVRIVIGVDPAVSAHEESDLTGIVAAGIDEHDHGYVLEDASGRYQPHEWSAKVASLYWKWKADRVIAEINQGGALVESNLRMTDPNIAYEGVHATRGKIVRAEPVANLFEQGRISIVGSMPQLEDQLCSFSNESERRRGDSPDRADALVYAISSLMVDRVPWGGLIQYYQDEARKAGFVGYDNETGPIRGTGEFGDVAAITVQMRAPPTWTGGQICGMSKTIYQGFAAGQVIDVHMDDQIAMRRNGFTEIDEAPLADDGSRARPGIYSGI